jgi:hypothetical protein
MKHLDLTELNARYGAGGAAARLPGQRRRGGRASLPAAV